MNLLRNRLLKKKGKSYLPNFLSNKYAKDILYFYAHWWISNDVFIFVTFKKSEINILYGNEAASLKYGKIKYVAFRVACFFDTISLYCCTPGSEAFLLSRLHLIQPWHDPLFHTFVTHVPPNGAPELFKGWFGSN